MKGSIELHPRARVVSIGGNELNVRLDDGRTISVPLSWFPRLLTAPSDQRQNFRLIGGGEGIHWPDIDEDLSVAGLLAGWHTASHAVVQEHERGAAESPRILAPQRQEAIIGPVGEFAQSGVFSTPALGQPKIFISHAWESRDRESLGYVGLTQGQATVPDEILRRRKTQSAGLGQGLGVSLEQMIGEQPAA
jgi:hypothetical protein